MLLLHIIIALTSVGFSTFVFFAPSNMRLRLSYGLIALTLMTGTYLVLSVHSSLLQACMSGLLYVSVVAVILFAAQRKLVMQEARKHR